jgi:hypothetical protein
MLELELWPPMSLLRLPSCLLPQKLRLLRLWSLLLLLPPPPPSVSGLPMLASSET